MKRSNSSIFRSNRENYRLIGRVLLMGGTMQPILGTILQRGMLSSAVIEAEGR